MSKNILIGAFLVLLGGGGAYVYVISKRPSANFGDAPQAGACAKHGVPESVCPWCDPSLVEKKGVCAAHDVPEALCWKCEPSLIAGFEAENDWCAGHSVPESRCELCKAGDLPPGEKKSLGTPRVPGGEQ